MKDIHIDLLHRDLWVCSISLVIISLLAIYFQSSVILISGVFISFVYWISRSFVHNRIRFPGGVPNIITLSRFFFLLISTLLCTHISLFQLGIIYALVCIADIFDGYFARKLDQASVLGEYLDKEVDAVFVLVLCLIIYLKIHQSYWVMIPGLIRYVYFTGMYFFMDENNKEPKDPWARIIAVFLFIALIGQFLLPLKISKPLLMVSTVAVLYSFGRSIKYHLSLITKK